MNADPHVGRVLQVHTRYRQGGGEDQVVEAERQLLEAAGVSVQQVIFHNADLREGRSAAADVRLAASAIWSRAAVRRVRHAIRAQQPDVMHVHNTFAAASPSVFTAADGLPVVHTLHNYRMVCPVATVFRDGHACTDCVGRAVPWPGVLHACVHGSRAQSAVAAATVTLHRAVGTFRRHVGTYVALTAFQRGLMIEGGLPADRIRVISNFLEPDPGAGERPRSGILYVGRLAEEKGIGVLLRASVLAGVQVRVAGTGPLKSAVEQAAATGDIVHEGSLEPSAVIGELRTATALVLPSIWFEGYPLAVVEAYATGTPVIASRIGSLAEIVQDGVTGLLAEPHDADGLADRMRWATEHPTEMRQMGLSARRHYETHLRGANHLDALMQAYRAAGARGSADRDDVELVAKPADDQVREAPSEDRQG
ncbi:MAG: glycosyltransferase [Chloroflexota bacterium]